MTEFARVCVPVTDLRSTPVRASLFDSTKLLQEPLAIKRKDLSQETQLLYFEPVRLLQKENGWAFVEALEQLVYDEALGFMRGYQGWVEEKDLFVTAPGENSTVCISAKKAFLFSEAKQPLFALSMGTKLHSLDGSKNNAFQPVLLHNKSIGYVSKEAFIKKPFEACMSLVSDPYLWGGLSSFDPENKSINTGCDCSALTLFYYRLRSQQLPRNAKDQFRFIEACSSSDLEEGDLIFRKSVATGKIDHVMLYAGNDFLLEATTRTGNIRYVPCSIRMGVSIHEYELGSKYDGGMYSWGKVLV